MSKFVTVVIVAALAIILGIYFLGSRSGSNTKTSAMKTSEANYQLDKTEADLGSMTVNQTKDVEFSFKNTGPEAIQLSHVQTSCNCTTAKIRIGDEDSPDFNMPMHMSSSEAGWQKDLPTGQTATITVTYDPSKMPVYGAIERYATFMANSKEIKLTIKANVQ